MSGVTSLNSITGVVACVSQNTGALNISGAGQNVVFQPLAGGVTEITAGGQVSSGAMTFVNGTGVTITNDGFNNLTFTGSGGGSSISQAGGSVAVTGTGAITATPATGQSFTLSASDTNINATAMAVATDTISISGSSTTVIDGQASVTVSTATGNALLATGSATTITAQGTTPGTLTVGGTVVNTGLYVSNSQLLYNGNAVGGSGGSSISQGGGSVAVSSTGAITATAPTGQSLTLSTVGSGSLLISPGLITLDNRINGHIDIDGATGVFSYSGLGNGQAFICNPSSKPAGALKVGGSASTTGLYIDGDSTILNWNGVPLASATAGGLLVAQTGNARPGVVYTGVTNVSAPIPIIDLAPPITNPSWYGGASVTWFGSLTLSYAQTTTIGTGVQLAWIGVQLVPTDPAYASTTSSQPFIFATPVVLTNNPPATATQTATSPAVSLSAYTSAGISSAPTAKAYSIVALFNNYTDWSLTPITAVGPDVLTSTSTGYMNNIVYTTPAISF